MKIKTMKIYNTVQNSVVRRICASIVPLWVKSVKLGGVEDKGITSNSGYGATSENVWIRFYALSKRSTSSPIIA